MLNAAFRQSRLIFFYKKIALEPDLLLWKLRGSPSRRTPHLVKQRVLREYAVRFQLQTLIETGTQYGQMISAMRKQFRDIYSIELDDANYALAIGTFAQYRHIHLLHGDSAVELPRLLPSISEPCLFWLDGHTHETPIMEELRAVFNHGPYRHVILIDDAHCFDSSKYYPTLQAVRDLAAQNYPGATLEVRDNIIRIHK